MFLVDVGGTVVLPGSADVPRMSDGLLLLQESLELFVDLLGTWTDVGLQNSLLF